MPVFCTDRRFKQAIRGDSLEKTCKIVVSQLGSGWSKKAQRDKGTKAQRHKGINAGTTDFSDRHKGTKAQRHKGINAGTTDSADLAHADGLLSVKSAVEKYFGSGLAGQGDKRG